MALFDLPTVDTPALVVDADVLDANITRWAKQASQRGLVLRPHVKTHKSPVIAHKQLAAGAAGITVATLSEAEVFADAGCTDIFQAYPLWATGDKAARLAALHERITLTVGVDSPAGAQTLARAVAGSSTPLRAMVEVDSGQHRTGVAPEVAGQVAAAAADVGLHVVGVFTHGGHVYATADAAQAARDEQNALLGAAQGLADAGVPGALLSSGSTPTARFDQPGVTEQRPGVYVFGDAQQLHLGGASVDDVALVVLATVVSRHSGQFVLDVGSKTLGMDRPSWLDGYGHLPAFPDARIERLSEHHAVVVAGGTMPDLGSVVGVIPNHVCNAVNLFDTYTVSRKGLVVGHWPITARGHST